MAHKLVWEDARMVGYTCDKGPKDDWESLSDEEPKVCEYCGKTLNLYWDVHIIEK